jgi:hypothetical protein
MIGQHKPTRDNKDCTFEDFQRAGEASFEHHWNNHGHCGLWCQAKSWTEEEKVKGKRKYQDKETHEREYKQQLQVKEKYLSPERLSNHIVERVEIMAISAEQAICVHKTSVARSTRVRM